jgi:ABC-2 type transport system permease protein
MHHLRLIWQFIRLSTQQEMAYRANFFISLLHSALNFGTGLLGIMVLFGQIDALQGWSFDETLAILGIFLTVGAVRGIFIGPSLDALAGLGGEIWTGRFDFTVLFPVNTQFLASVRHWRPLALFDLVLGLGTLFVAVSRLGQSFDWLQLMTFLVAFTSGMIVLYAILLIFTALVFWNPGFLFTWVFNGLFQLARYPVGLYPGWLKLILTWVVPLGFVTTVPAQALTTVLPVEWLFASLILATGLLIVASVLFHTGLRQYASASS